MNYLIYLIIFVSFSAQAIPTSRPTVRRLNTNASFAETWSRYPSPYGIMQQLKRIVPGATSYAASCSSLDAESAPVAGVIDPMQLSALEQEPGALFFQWYQDCVRKLTVYAEVSVEGSRQILGASLSDEILGVGNVCDGGMKCLFQGWTRYGSPEGEKSVVYNFWNNRWNVYSSDWKRKFVSRFITYLVGPDPILLNERLIGADNAFGLNIPDRDALVEFLVSKMNELPEEMPPLEGQNYKTATTLKVVYGEIALWLRLGPSLKN